jgi:hypothetical protein
LCHDYLRFERVGKLATKLGAASAKGRIVLMEPELQLDASPTTAPATAPTSLATNLMLKIGRLSKKSQTVSYFPIHLFDNLNQRKSEKKYWFNPCVQFFLTSLAG